MTLGWPPNENIGTQVLIAKKNARFLELWLDGYRKYKARSWYYNAGQYPTEQILAKDKSIAHTVPKLFGVHNLLDKLYGTADWEDWKTYYTLHLLSRHPPAPLELNETTILNYTSPFGEISRWILFDLVPKVRLSTVKEFFKSSTTWKSILPPDNV
ncbi:uncharacterized protein LOC111043659 [Nilaparvata lugens]|uniref:uncharacterized protein LOC111043659 n=1 Tax=Nilaparvata lugens TaxID=108931 RepID=UPI00193DC911|nr:uncharacterized protein LOC111043659 [Nilaparvata lugens]